MNTLTTLSSILLKSAVNINSFPFINSRSLGIVLDASGTAVSTLGEGYAPNAIGINPTNQNTTCLTLRGTTTNTTMLMPNGVSSNFTIYLKHASRFYTDSIFGHGYSLTSSATSVVAGSSFTVTFYSLYPTINLPYTITGVLSSDLSGASLTGTFTSYQAITYTVSNTMSALKTFSMQAGTQTLTVTLTNPNPPLYPVVQYLFQNNLLNSGTASNNDALFGNVNTTGGSASLSLITPISGSLSYSTAQTRKGRTYSIYDNTGATCNYIIARLNGINFSSGMTITAWYHIISMSASSILLQALLSTNYNYATYSAGTFCMYSGNGSVNPSPLGFAGSYPVILENLYTFQNTWVHIAQVYSVSGTTTTLNVYVNNTLVTSGGFPNYQVSTSLSGVPFIGTKLTTGLGIFGLDTNTGYKMYKGYLDDYRVYNSALTAAQISNVYNN